jgi:hypothetical protein
VVAGQIEKECTTREKTLKKYLAFIRRMKTFFKGFIVVYINRNKNDEANELTKAVARNTPLLANVFLQIIVDASIKTIEPEPIVINIIQGEDWRAPIMAYLRHYYEPDSTVEQARMQQRAQAYKIGDNDLYKISVSGPLLRYISKEEGHQIFSEVHAGVCGGHIGAKTLATKVLR